MYIQYLLHMQQEVKLEMRPSYGNSRLPSNKEASDQAPIDLCSHRDYEVIHSQISIFTMGILCKTGVRRYSVRILLLSGCLPSNNHSLSFHAVTGVRCEKKTPNGSQEANKTKVFTKL